jgi:hypothetical protein
MVLNKELSRAEQQIVVGRDIAKVILERTSFKEGSELITGCALFSIDNECLRTIGKALACLSNLPEVDTIHISEGIPYKLDVTEMEVKERLLDEMYLLLKDKLSVDDDPDDETNDDNIDDNKLPEDVVMTIFLKMCEQCPST